LICRDAARRQNQFGVLAVQAFFGKGGIEIEVGDGDKRRGDQPHDREQQLSSASLPQRGYASSLLAGRTWFNQIPTPLQKAWGRWGWTTLTRERRSYSNPAQRDRAKDLRDLAAPYARKARPERFQRCAPQMHSKPGVWCGIQRAGRRRDFSSWR
jgi:hypothetical protein